MIFILYIPLTSGRIQNPTIQFTEIGPRMVIMIWARTQFHRDMYILGVHL